MTSRLNSAKSAAFHSEANKPLKLIAFQSEIRLLGTDAGDNQIMCSSVQVENLTKNRFPPRATSMVPYQIELQSETALSCANPIDIPVQASPVEPSPQDAKYPSKVELDKSANDVDHDSSLRLRVVLRSLFQAVEPVSSSMRTKDPKIEHGGILKLGELSGDARCKLCKDTPLERDHDICSTVTNKLMEAEMAKKEGYKELEETVMLQDETVVQQEFVTAGLDLSSCMTVETTDFLSQEEELALENNVDFLTLTTTHIDEVNCKFPLSKSTKAPVEITDFLVEPVKVPTSFEFTGLNHVAFCCENLERTLEFYCGLLGLKTSPDRPELPYRGAWLLLGAEGIHLMEVPNPDPVHGRPGHGGFDRHACLNCKNVEGLRQTLEKAGIPYQLSMVPSIFCRDPDGNGLEFIEIRNCSL